MIDVAIGMALIYFLFSGFVSGIQELLAALYDRRGRFLKNGVARLLGEAKTTAGEAKLILDKLYAHPMISVLSGKSSGMPSYIPSESFAIALADSLVRDYQSTKPLFRGLPEVVGQMPQGELRHTLEVLVTQSQGDAEKLQRLIESHFNSIMDRVSGWYKKWTQVWLMAIGLAVAIFLNVDSIALAQRLGTDEALRLELVEKAEAAVKAGKIKDAPQGGESNDGLANATKELSSELKAFQSLDLPIGWPRDSDGWAKWPYPGLLPVVGWLITAIAASLGSPFWFDALSKLVPLRSSGVRPITQTISAAGDGSTMQSTLSALAATRQAVAVEPSEALQARGAITDFEVAGLTALDIEGIQLCLGMPPELATGDIDQATRNALRQWQEKCGVPTTGVLDEPTVLNLLYRKQ